MKLLALGLIGLVSLAAQAAAPFGTPFFNVHEQDVENGYKFYTAQGRGPRTVNFYVADGVVKAAGAFAADAISDVRMHFGINQQEFNRRFAINGRDGYRPKEISVPSNFGIESYYVTWEKNVGNLPTAVWINMTAKEFDQKWNDLVKTQGYRVSRHVQYFVGTAKRHAAIFVKDGRPFLFYRGMSTENLGDRNREAKAKGLFISDISVQDIGAGHEISAVWTNEFPNQSAKFDMDAAALRSSLETHRAGGFKLRKVIGYNLGRSFAAIWTK